MPPTSLITNYLPPYRLPLYRLLHERYGVEVHCFGGEGAVCRRRDRDLDRQLEEAPFPAHRLARQGDAGRVAGESEAAIVALTGPRGRARRLARRAPGTDAPSCCGRRCGAIR